MTGTEERTPVDAAIKAWEQHGPTSLTVALVVDALYGAQDEVAHLRGHVAEAADRVLKSKAAETRLAFLGEAVADLCWKATPMGETADGDVHAYILPKGTVHRLIGAAQSVGIPAAFRALTPPTPPVEQEGGAT